MANKFYLVIGVALSFVVTSCGTGKKLEAAEAKINEANAKNAQLNNNIDQLNAQVASLTQDKDHITSDFVRYRQQCEGISVKYKSANSILRQQETILKQIDEKLESA